LMEIVLACGFNQTDAAAINNALASSMFKYGKDRRKQQDYSSMYDYFSEADWKVLSNPTVNDNSKITVVASRAIALGCRCPTEHTFKAWTSMIIALGGQESYMMLTPEEKKKKMDFVKADFRRVCRRVGDPIAWLPKLPAVPADIPIELRTSAFADGVPVACAMPGLIAEVNKVDMSFGCRSGRLDLGQTTLMKVGTGSPLMKVGTGSQLQDIACVMMQGMQQMAQQQNQMMQMMLAGGSSNNTAFNNIRLVTTRQPAVCPRQPLPMQGYDGVDEVSTLPLPGILPEASPAILPEASPPQSGIAAAPEARAEGDSYRGRCAACREPQPCSLDGYVGRQGG